MRPSGQCRLREVRDHRSYHHSGRRLPGGTPAPGERLGAGRRRLPPPPRRQPHTKFPLWEHGGLGTGSFSHRETRFGFSPRAQLGLCLDAAASPAVWPPCRGHSVQTQALPSGPFRGWAQRHHRGRQGTCQQHRTQPTFPTKTSLRTYYAASSGWRGSPPQRRAAGVTMAHREAMR